MGLEDTQEGEGWDTGAASGAVDRWLSHSRRCWQIGWWEVSREPEEVVRGPRLGEGAVAPALIHEVPTSDVRSLGEVGTEWRIAAEGR